MSWEFKRLADICDIRLGKTPSRNEKSYWDAEKVGSNIWVSIADLTKLKTRFISDSKEYISNKGAALFNPVKAGTLLMSFKLSIGKLAYAECDLYTNEAIVALPIKDRSQLSSEFLYYYLQFYDWDKETENDVKLKGKTLNKAKLNEIKVPLPPLATQKKIVAKLDVLFAEIDKASAAAEANAKNAEALFQSYLTQTFQNVSTDWKQTTLDKVCRITNGSTPKRDNPRYWNGGIVSWFTIEDIRRFGRVITETTQHVTQYALEDTSLKVLPSNSVLLCCTASVGEYAIIKKEMATNQQFNGLTVTDKNLLPEFLFWYAATMKSLLLSVSGKVTIDFVPISRLKSLPILFPSVEKQLDIVSRLNRLDVEVKSIKDQYLKKNYELISLRQSILRKAFSGELIKE